MKNQGHKARPSACTHQLTMVVDRRKLAAEPEKFAATRVRLLAVGVHLILIASDAAPE